jgi:hypothetical protein
MEDDATGWESCRLLISFRGGDALFLITEPVAREWRREIRESVVVSLTRGLSPGEERTELCGLVDFCRSATLGSGVIICRIRPIDIVQ